MGYCRAVYVDAIRAASIPIMIGAKACLVRSGLKSGLPSLVRKHPMIIPVRNTASPELSGLAH
jgi:hypothetical protein